MFREELLVDSPERLELDIDCVEIEERYCEIAAQRCAQEVLAFG